MRRTLFKKTRLTEAKKLTRYLDKICSEYVRKRAMKRVGGCERCLSKKKSWKDLDWAHFHGRANKHVRWDDRNGAGLCGGCHFYLDGDPLQKIEFFEKLLGENEFTMLECQAYRGTKPDKEALILYYEQKLKEENNVRNV